MVQSKQQKVKIGRRDRLPYPTSSRVIEPYLSLFIPEMKAQQESSLPEIRLLPQSQPDFGRRTVPESSRENDCACVGDNNCACE